MENTIERFLMWIGTLIFASVPFLLPKLIEKLFAEGPMNILYISKGVDVRKLLDFLDDQNLTEFVTIVSERPKTFSHRHVYIVTHNRVGKKVWRIIPPKQQPKTTNEILVTDIAQHIHFNVRTRASDRTIETP